MHSGECKTKIEVTHRCRDKNATLKRTHLKEATEREDMKEFGTKDAGNYVVASFDSKFFMTSIANLSVEVMIHHQHCLPQKTESKDTLTVYQPTPERTKEARLE